MAKLITYDLRLPGQDYSKLINAIKAYPDWCKVTESCWVISTRDSCETVRNNLLQHMDSNDRLLVANLTGEAAWNNVMCGNDVLKRLLNG